MCEYDDATYRLIRLTVDVYKIYANNLCSTFQGFGSLPLTIFSLYLLETMCALHTFLPVTISKQQTSRRDCSNVTYSA